MILKQKPFQTNHFLSLFQKQIYHSLFREKAMATHSSTVAWQIPWTEEPGRLQSMGLLGVGHDWSDLAAAAAEISFKKITDTKGTFHAKMGSIKDRNGTDLTKAEDFKKMWKEYTEELYKKNLHDPDNHDGVITHTHL